MTLRDNNREMGTREAAKYLGYTLSTLRNKASLIRHRKERNVLYFTAEALDEFRAAQSHEHIPEPLEVA